MQWHMVRSKPLKVYSIRIPSNHWQIILNSLISQTILEELDTKYTLLQLNRHEETGGVALPEGCKEREQAILVVDNIDINEEILSGVYFEYLKKRNCRQ